MKPFGPQARNMLERVAHASLTVVNGMVVCSGQRIETDVDQMAQTIWVHLEVEGFVGRAQSIAVGDHGLKVGEIDVAIDQRRKPAGEILPGCQTAMAVAATWTNRLPAATEPEISTEDNHEM